MWHCFQRPLFAEVSSVAGTTGTGLDGWVSIIVNDPGLNHRISVEDISGGAEAADAINQMIIDGIIATGVANDGTLNAADLYDVNRWFQADDDRYAEFVELHGDDEQNREWGFHLVQNDGATTRLFARNAVNTVFDGTYHIGFDIAHGRFENEDGNRNASVESVAHWLDQLLRPTLEAGDLVSGADPFADVVWTGTGLDLLTSTIIEDDGLNTRIATSEIAEGTIAFTFTADDITGRDALFSKDASGYRTGGHLTAFVEADGDLYVRFQDTDRQVQLVARDLIDEGETYSFAFTFGDGAALRGSISTVRKWRRPRTSTSTGRATRKACWSAPTPGPAPTAGRWMPASTLTDRSTVSRCSARS